MTTMQTADRQNSLVLRSRSGLLTLVLLCAVQFLDIVDSAIVNVALPSIQRDLHFSPQNLQWVASGYILTYGGFLLLGGRLSDLLGRRRILFAGLAIFGTSSLVAGLSGSSGLLVTARLVQGVGAALMAPAALSTLTTSFRAGRDRTVALGVWGAISGLAAATGVFLGGVFTSGPGWRWVFFVNPPISVLVAVGAVVLLSSDRPGRSGQTFDTQGAALVTGAMLLLVYGLVQAPTSGWTAATTLTALVGAGALAVLFAVNEARSLHPLIPFSILQVKGLVAADITQLIAFTGFFSMFFYATLYMQDVLGYTPLHAGVAYLPITAGFGTAGVVASVLVTRIGTRPLVIAACLVAASGIYLVSRVPVHGSYATDLLPGFLLMSLGAGSVFVSVTAAANAGVPHDKAGLAAGLLNASQQLGSALGLAVLSAIAIARTRHLATHHVARVAAADAGYHRALLAGAILMAGAAGLALRIANTREAAPIVMVNAPEPDMV